MLDELSSEITVSLLYIYNVLYNILCPQLAIDKYYMPRE